MYVCMYACMNAVSWIRRKELKQNHLKITPMSAVPQANNH